MATPKVYKKFVRGEWIESATGQAFENLNPANRHQLIGVVSKPVFPQCSRMLYLPPKRLIKHGGLCPLPERG